VAVRYLFQFSDGEGFSIDPVDLDLPDSTTALNWAQDAACQFERELAGDVQDWSKWRVRIVDKVQRSEFILPFSYIRRRAAVAVLLTTWGLDDPAASTGPGQRFWR
jgi:hypothetical protein